MPLAHRLQQPPGPPIDIASWASDEEHPVFPVGSKAKKLVICPGDAGNTYLIPNHRYIFKMAVGWQAQQVWSEIIAYELSRTIAFEVPPSFLACDSRTGEIGVLVEFFYGYPNDEMPPRLLHALDILHRLYQPTDYDIKAGRPHHIKQNLTVCRALAIKDSVKWWGRALAFDTVIGNTDRHPENWGFLRWRTKEGRGSITMAPIFDNGTSLGYEQAEHKLDNLTGDVLERYISRGRHHCSLDASDQVGARHHEMCGGMIKLHPIATSGAIKEVLALSPSRVQEIVEWAAKFESPLTFSEQRATFVARLVNARLSQLARAIGEMT